MIDLKAVRGAPSSSIRTGTLTLGLTVGVVLGMACTPSPNTAGPETPPGTTPGTNTPNPTPTPVPPPERKFEPGPQIFRRLLAGEYRASIESIFGADAAAVAQTPPDGALNGFDAIGASQLALDDVSTRTYETSAQAISDLIASQGSIRERYTECEALSVDAPDCFAELVTSLGRRLWRRPLTTDETQRWVTVGRSAATRLGSFEEGAKWVVYGLLQSPNFIYRAELGRTIPGRTDYTLEPFAFATRLSYFLTGTTPDDQLLDAAERGQLDDPKQVRLQAERLLESPAAKKALSHFYDEVLRLREIEGVVKDATLYPAWSPELGRSMRIETLMLIDDLVWNRDADFTELFDANYTFVDRRLRGHYGLNPRGSDQFVRVELPPDGKRGGILGHASFQTLLSHGVTTSPTLRGKFVREALLCQAIPAPPPNVNTNIPTDAPGEPARTMRERLEQHQTEPACRGCHLLTDPIGLGLENFDAIGAFRTEENGISIDPSGSLDGKDFEGALALGEIIRSRKSAIDCVVRNLFRSATGHVEERGEWVEIEKIDAAFEASGYRMKSLLVEIAVSKAFRAVRAIEE